MNIGKETELIEFKKSTSETKEAVISITSILNKHGKGVLYFGVKDNGDVAGQEIGKDTERKLSRDISDNVRPSIWYQIQTKYADDGSAFIEVQFNGANAPYSAYGKYYQRFADEDRQISDAELERLFRSRRKDYSEWENSGSDETVSDVDRQLLEKVIRDGIESGRIKYAYTDAASVLSKLGLLDPQTLLLTNAGKVLFSKNRPILLKTAVYAGTTKETFLKLNHFEGNVYECIDEGISFILSAISWDISITGNAKRKEEPEIPQRAIREIVVNAFAHGCYFSNTAFAIEIFSDRVAVYSPGNFPAGFTPEDFAYKAEEPIMMNPRIATTLFKSSMIESFGSGFECTFSACKEAGVRYEYENTLTGFRFVFYRRQRLKKGREMTGTEKAVFGLLKEKDDATLQQMASAINKSTKTVYRAIKELKEQGYVVREGGDNNGYWKVLK